MTRFCIEEYINPKNKKDLKSIYGQLTNYSLAKFHKDYQNIESENGNKQTMETVFEILENEGYDTD